MNGKFLGLPFGAAIRTFAAASLLSFIAGAHAQDNPAPADNATPPAADSSTPPPDAAAPAEAAPADTAAAPADATAAAPAGDTATATEAAPATPDAAQAPLPTIPVKAGDNAEPAKDTTRLDTIEVTGSRIRRTDFESAQPVLILTRKDIERTGLTSIGDLLQKLPAAGTALGTTVNNGGSGAVEVDLRNLTSARVLVLVNGHRWVNGLSSTSTSSVDLTTIPISVIERVEVLKDGASAIYGSDAIAGVINIITRKDYSGAEFRTQAGVYSKGDGLTQSHSLSIGSIIDKTSLFFDLSFTRQDAIYNGTRELTSVPTFGTGSSRGSGGIPQGHFQFVPTPQTASGLTAADPMSCTGAPLCDVTVKNGATGATFADFRHFDKIKDPYNYAPVNYLLTPNERTGVFGQISRQLTPDIAFHTELLYNLRRSAQNLAPMPILAGDLAPPPFDTLFVSATNTFNRLGQDIGKGASGPLTPGSGLARNRSLLYGNRVFSEDVDTIRAGFSFDGGLDLAAIRIPRLINWDLGYSYAETKQKQTNEGLYDLTRLAQALGPATGCLAPCVPFSLFGANITQQMLGYVSYTGIGSTRALRRDLYLNLSTELFQFFDNGPVGMAVGAERREEAYQNQPDPLVVSGTSSGNRAKPTGGGYDVNEYYTELSLPLLRNVDLDSIPGLSNVAWLKDRGLAKELDLSLAGRLSEYGSFGNAKTGKVGLRWKPVDDLLVRGTYSSAFRAPNLGELFLGNSDSFPGILDYCSQDVRATNANANTNCGTDGVSSAYVQISGQLLQVLSGNPNLKAETAHTGTAGIVYSPSYVPDLNIYVDWYRISANKFISVLDAQGIFDSCYNVAPSQRSQCQYIKRNATSGQVTEIDTPFLNLARVRTEGVDFKFDYALPWRARGDFKLLFDSTYLTAFDQFNPGSGNREILDPNFKAGRHATLGAAFPRFKANGTLEWKSANWNASWSTRYIGPMTENCVDGIGDETNKQTLRDLGLCSKPTPGVRADDPTTPNVDETVTDMSQNVLKPTFYHSVQIGYELADWGTQLVLGVNNVLDTDPPPSYATSTIYTFEPTQYDIPGGRFPYVRLSKTF